MPDLRTTDLVIAIACSDLHLSHQPPLARAGESNWYAAMIRALQQLRALKDQWKVPVIYAGDIFDRWNAPAELINFALQYLPTGYAIPGQHDMPYHCYDLLHRSAYGTLVAAGHLNNLKEPITLDSRAGSVTLYGFPWGTALRSCPDAPHTFDTKIAIAHSFLWTKATGYPGAPEGGRLASMRTNLRGYDCAVFGDNHNGFVSSIKPRDSRTTIMNCGTFMRRKADEIEYKPQVGLIRASGHIESVFLDTDNETMSANHLAAEAAVENKEAIKEFVKDLGDLSERDHDFRETLERLMEERSIAEPVKQFVLGALE